MRSVTQTLQANGTSKEAHLQLVAPVSRANSKNAGDDASSSAAKTATSNGKEVEDVNFQRNPTKLVWLNVFYIVSLHCFALMGLKQCLTEVPLKIMLYAWFVGFLAVLAIIGGMHRLYSHRAYKAKFPLELFYVIVATMAGQNSVYIWARDHRMHHKYVDTDADPHNINRGLVFSHVGWLVTKKHPELKRKGATLDMSDLKSNPLVMHQYRNYFLWYATIGFTLPLVLPVLLWGESWYNSFTIGFALRHAICLHIVWTVNSVAHYWGAKPYDKTIHAREQPYLMMSTLGEGFHNYHHVFPQDYRASEHGRYFNFTTFFIDMCSSIGLAYDLRSPSQDSIDARKLRTGDPYASVIGDTFIH